MRVTIIIKVNLMILVMIIIMKNIIMDVNIMISWFAITVNVNIHNNKYLLESLTLIRIIFVLILRFIMQFYEPIKYLIALIILIDLCDKIYHQCLGIIVFLSTKETKPCMISIERRVCLLRVGDSWRVWKWADTNLRS